MKKKRRDFITLIVEIAKYSFGEVENERAWNRESEVCQRSKPEP